jgi:predicted metal-dependent phosphotriesterase family hydrolase
LSTPSITGGGVAEEGVDLGNAIIGHSGDSEGLDYLQRLLDNGSYLGMDRFGLDNRLPFDKRIRTVVELTPPHPAITSGRHSTGYPLRV